MQGYLYIGSSQALPTSVVKSKYNLKDIVRDDSNNRVGVVTGYFIDANEVKYAVVTLFSPYRVYSRIEDNEIIYYSDTDTLFTSTVSSIVGLPNQNSWNMYQTTLTATERTTLMMNAGTSPACITCRNISITIDGITYHGQLPNAPELLDMMKYYSYIDSVDPDDEWYNSEAWQQYDGDRPMFARVDDRDDIWSSSKESGDYWFIFDGMGGPSTNYSTDDRNFVFPVLEIPLN